MGGSREVRLYLWIGDWEFVDQERLMDRKAKTLLRSIWRRRRPLTKALDSAVETLAKHKPNSCVFADRLQKTTDEFLVSILRHEHPQTIAFILTHLAAERVAKIVSLLPGQSQVDVLQRIVEYRRSVDWAAAEVRNQVEAQVEVDQQRTSFVSQLSPFLNAADEKSREEILEHVHDVDACLANRLESPST